jgi:hypothetical protein
MHTSIHSGGTGNIRHPPLAKRVKAATPKLTWAKVGAAASSGPAGQPHGLRGSRSQNIENNPMQSSLAVAGMRDPAKTV